MNSSAITSQSDYDYRFVFYLINEVFGKQTLAKSAAYTIETGNHKFQSLDQGKLAFVQDVFNERVGNNEKRRTKLNTHINKRCNTLRNSLKKKP